MRRAPLTSGERRCLVALAAVLALPLLVACWLVPDPRGSGTHEKLGLPACGFQARFGLRCPTCGMTTAWAHLVRGQVRAAVRASAAGSLLAVTDAIGVAWLVVCSILGRWWPTPFQPVAVVWFGGTVTALALAEWAVRLGGYWLCSSGNP